MYSTYIHTRKPDPQAQPARTFPLSLSASSSGSGGGWGGRRQQVENPVEQRERKKTGWHVYNFCLMQAATRLVSSLGSQLVAAAADVERVKPLCGPLQPLSLTALASSARRRWGSLLPVEWAAVP